jgi:hypothetical protein
VDGVQDYKDIQLIGRGDRPEPPDQLDRLTVWFACEHQGRSSVTASSTPQTGFKVEGQFEWLVTRGLSNVQIQGN